MADFCTVCSHPGPLGEGGVILRTAAENGFCSPFDSGFQVPVGTISLLSIGLSLFMGTLATLLACLPVDRWSAVPFSPGASLHEVSDLEVLC